jgi:hypothetical protein
MFIIVVIVVPLKTLINLSSALSTLLALKVLANVTVFKSKNTLAASVALPEHYINEFPVKHYRTALLKAFSVKNSANGIY